MVDRPIGGFVPEEVRATGLIGAWMVQFRVITALMIREAMARYGRESLGFFWLIGEPLVLSTGVMIIWSFAEGHVHGSMSMLPMALSGYATLTLQRHMISRSVHKFRHSAPLMFHRRIRMIDSLLATTFLEGFGVFTSFLLAYAALYLFGAVDPIRDPLLMLGAWALWVWNMFAFGLLVACITELIEWTEYFVSPVMYFSLPVSGTFFLMDWFSPGYRQLLSWSPQVNANEMFRASFFPVDIPMYWNAWYLVWSAIIVTAVGLFLYDYAKLAIRYE